MRIVCCGGWASHCWLGCSFLLWVMGGAPANAPQREENNNTNQLQWASEPQLKESAVGCGLTWAEFGWMELMKLMKWKQNSGSIPSTNKRSTKAVTGRGKPHQLPLLFIHPPQAWLKRRKELNGKRVRACPAGQTNPISFHEIEGRSAATTQSFIHTNQPPIQHKPKKFGFVDWFVELVEWIERKELCCCAICSFISPFWLLLPSHCAANKWKRMKENFILMKFYLLIVKETNGIELKYIITVRLHTTFMLHLLYFWIKWMEMNGGGNAARSQQTTINLNFLFENEKVGLIWLIAALLPPP